MFITKYMQLNEIYEKLYGLYRYQGSILTEQPSAYILEYNTE